ncbi:MAG: hypothetical protein NZ879_04720 [Archaeoglobaceae archaeon]|nr:hypothetical protein [Archaeoglobaceae archaeon]MDW8118267.1 hypothetical protein [Archaeoglobaceae archaeon]
MNWNSFQFFALNVSKLLSSFSTGKRIVKIWDKGEYEILKKNEKEIKFKVDGQKLKCVYVLLKFKKAGEDSWLLMKLSE